MVGFASDGCNTMMGAHNSVITKLQADFPGVVILKCICHSIHLCASEACKQLPQECEDLAKDIYGFFKQSSKRIISFRQFQEFCNAEPHKILKLSQTRWLSLLNVVKRINEQWDALNLFFTSQWLEYKLPSARKNYCYLNDISLRLYYYFLEWILPKLTTLNEKFQSDQVVVVGLHKKMCESYKEILSIYLNQDYVNRTPLNVINPNNSRYFINPINIHLGANVLNHKSKLSKQELDKFLIHVRKFLITTCEELKKRYDFDHPLLSKLHIFAPRFINKPCSILDVISLVPRIVTRNETCRADTINDQWKHFVLYAEKPAITDFCAYWANVYNMQDLDGNYLYKDLVKFIFELFTLPHSNAACERVFSKANLNVTKIRSRLATKTINSIIITSDELKRNNGCYNCTPDKTLINKMTSANLYPRTATTTTDKSINNENMEDDKESIFV